MKVQRWNDEEGSMSGNDCRKCKNKGYIMFIDDAGYEVLKECECMPARKSIAIIRKSGLDKLLDEYTFEKYTTGQAWQKHIKAAAMRYLDDLHGNWFYVGGQVGSGKSHICTAIVKELMMRGNEALYMRWRDDSVVLKKSIMADGSEYADDIGRFKNVKVLYIDDFFKSEKGKAPSAADINLAFEILNHRYINKDLVTIISTEMSINTLVDIDEAIGSRIYQRSQNYCIELSEDPGKNIRMKGNKV